MKKLCLILALIMALGVLAGCSSGPDKDGFYHSGGVFDYDGFKVKVGKCEVVDDRVTVTFEVKNKRSDSYNNGSFATWGSSFNDEAEMYIFGMFDFVYYYDSIPGGDTVTMVAKMPYRGAGTYKIYATKIGSLAKKYGSEDPEEKVIVFEVKEAGGSDAASASANSTNTSWAEDYYNDVLSNLASPINDLANITNVEVIKYMAADGFSSVGEMATFNSIINRASDMGVSIGCKNCSEDSFNMEEDTDNVDMSAIENIFQNKVPYEEWVVRYYTEEVQSAFDYFYGKNFCDVKTAFANSTSAVVSYDGKYIYLVQNSVGGYVYDAYLNLADVSYSGDEAVLTLQIIAVLGEYDEQIYDLTSNTLLTISNEVDPYSLERTEVFKTLCEENNIDINDLTTIKLKLFRDSDGVHIAGWDGKAIY